MGPNTDSCSSLMVLCLLVRCMQLSCYISFALTTATPRDQLMAYFLGQSCLPFLCRLLPQFTPGRAMMWGTILALWGTGAIVASSSRSLGIRRVSMQPSTCEAFWPCCYSASDTPMLPACS